MVRLVHNEHNSEAMFMLNDHHGSNEYKTEELLQVASSNHGDNHMHHSVRAGEGMHHMGPSASHTMSMAFHLGVNETVLFSWWQIETVWGMVGSFIGILVLAILYEGLKFYREYLFRRTYKKRQAETPPAKPSVFSPSHLFQTFLHMLQVTISFMLMLIFMTFNVWLGLAVVLGAGVGYFIFFWKNSLILDITEHCQ